MRCATVGTEQSHYLVRDVGSPVYSCWSGLSRCWHPCLCSVRPFARMLSELHCLLTLFRSLVSMHLLIYHAVISLSNAVVAVDIADGLSHVHVGVDSFHQWWIAAKAVKGLAPEIRKLTALLQWMIVHQQVGDPFHSLRCKVLHPSVLQRGKKCLEPGMLLEWQCWKTRQTHCSSSRLLRSCERHCHHLLPQSQTAVLKTSRPRWNGHCGRLQSICSWVILWNPLLKRRMLSCPKWWRCWIILAFQLMIKTLPPVLVTVCPWLSLAKVFVVRSSSIL